MKQGTPQGPCWRVEWPTEQGYETSEGMSEGQAKFFCENIRQWVRNPRVIYVMPEPGAVKIKRKGKQLTYWQRALSGLSEDDRKFMIYAYETDKKLTPDETARQLELFRAINFRDGLRKTKEDKRKELTQLKVLLEGLKKRIESLEFDISQED